ncbi:MAG: hypothetical protein P1V18_06335 [Candidatus Gracilibacteria bacterium]|nr:hypothetical protein [Candidatus Gracilibacteria bacterium]
MEKKDKDQLKNTESQNQNLPQSSENEKGEHSLIPSELFKKKEASSRPFSPSIKKIALATTASVVLIFGVSKMNSKTTEKEEQNTPTLPAQKTPEPPKPRFVELKESDVERTKHEWAAFQNGIGRTTLFHQTYWEGKAEGKSSISKLHKDLIYTPDIQVSTSFIGKGRDEKMHLNINNQSFTIIKIGQGFQILKGENALKEIVGSAELSSHNQITFIWNEKEQLVQRSMDAQISSIGGLGINEIGEILCYFADQFEIQTERDNKNQITRLYFTDKKTGKHYETSKTNAFTFITKEKKTGEVFSTTLAKRGASYTKTPNGTSITPSEEISSFLWKGGNKWTAMRMHIQEVLKRDSKNTEKGN